MYTNIKKLRYMSAIYIQNLSRSFSRNKKPMNDFPVEDTQPLAGAALAPSPHFNTEGSMYGTFTLLIYHENQGIYGIFTY